MIDYTKLIQDIHDEYIHLVAAVEKLPQLSKSAIYPEMFALGNAVNYSMRVAENEKAKN